MRRVLDHFPAALIGWQEIDEADEADEHGILRWLMRRLRRKNATHRSLNRRTKGSGYWTVGYRQAVPISVPAPWTVVEADVTKACEGRPHVTPHRVIVRAVATHPDLADPVTFLNGHLPYRAEDLWLIAFGKWKKAVHDEHQAGRTTVVIMDSNHHGPMPSFHPRQEQLLHPALIDRIAVIPGSTDVKAGPRRSVQLTVDGHDAHGVDLVLSDKKEQ
jgi:hypothetical protein